MLSAVPASPTSGYSGNNGYCYRKIAIVTFIWMSDATISTPMTSESLFYVSEPQLVHQKNEVTSPALWDCYEDQTEYVEHWPSE